MLKNRWNENKELIPILIFSGGFFFWNPAVHAADATPADVGQKINKNQAPKMSPEQIMAFIKKNGKIESMPKIRNPMADEKHAAIIATLRTQKQAADAQRATFRAAIKEAPKIPAMNPSSAQPVATTSTPLMQSRSGSAGNIQMSKNVPSVGSSRLESEKVKPALNIPSAAVVQSKVSNVVSNVQMQCTPDRQGIWNINGKTGTKVVFTSDPNFNLYTIAGCKFGDTPGTAYIYGPFAAGQIKMQIEYWTDTQIVAKVDPAVQGELDHSGNVTLIVTPLGKPQMQDLGHSFYAMRGDPFVLNSAPSEVAVLQSVTNKNGEPVKAIYSSPILESGISGTLEVDRTSYYYSFPEVNDSFNLGNGLKPGFEVTEVSMLYYLPYYSHRTIDNIKFKGNTIFLPHTPVGMLHYDEVFDSWDVAYCLYILTVYVQGPVGFQSPWK